MYITRFYQNMTQFLPPNLLALFAPRDPVPYLPPLDKLPHEKKFTGFSGLAPYLSLFEDPKDTPPPTRVETKDERKERKRREKAEQIAYKLEQEIALYISGDPHNNSRATVDAFKSLFVARINYDTSESKLRREFEVYGAIKKIVMIHDSKTGKSRGYAFIEYEHERDMHSAYKHADGKKLDGRRVLVDVERGRTVKGWLPRRLGGGLGGTRRGGPDVNIKHSGREDNLKYQNEDRLEREGREGGGRVERFERPERGFDRNRDRKRSRSRERKRKSRSLSRSRERRRHRSRSKDRDRRRRSRSRERKRRDKDRDRRDREKPEEQEIKVKLEPQDDYGYGNYNYIKQEPNDEQHYGYSGFNAQDY